MEGIRINGDWHFENYNTLLQLLSFNDGLSRKDFKDWFAKPFAGQIICWNEKINY